MLLNTSKPPVTAITEGSENKKAHQLSLHSNMFQTNTATAFLNALGQSHTFLVLGEGASKGTAQRELHGTWEELEETIKALNETLGVYVTISQTDLTGRKKENIIAPRALFLDFDEEHGEPNPDKLEVLPQPSAIVQSKGGKHLYWFLQEGEPLEALEPALKRLIDFMGSDKSCKDMGRVMRIPGSIHHKEGAFQTELLELNDNRYTIAEVISNIPVESLVSTKTKAKTKAKVMPEETAKESIKPEGYSSFTSCDNFHSRLRKVLAKDRFQFFLETIRNAQNGERNALLNMVAFQAYELTALGVPEFFLEEQLTQAGLDCGLEASEVENTIKSAFEGAKTKGVGQTKAQKLWQEFDRLYGSSAFYNERSLFLTLDGKSIDFDSERIHYINSIGRDISGDRFTSELLGWVKAYHKSDPERDYLDSLPTMTSEEAFSEFQKLADVMGLGHDPYAVKMLMRHRIGRIARTYEPGCSMQWALGLTGDKGCGKTSYFSSYSPIQESYQDVDASLLASNSEDKDLWLKLLMGCVVSIDEIDTVARKDDFDRLKSILSKTHQTIRAPYARAVENQPLRFVWAFTANPDQALQDDGAGNRRYVVLKMAGTESQGIERAKYYRENCDRLNAAAKSLYLAGESWNLTEMERAIRDERSEDSINRGLPYALACQWLPVLAKFFDPSEPRPGFHIDQLNDLFTPANRNGKLHRPEKQGILKALKDAGWVNHQVKRNGARPTLWFPSHFPKESVTGMMSEFDLENTRNNLRSAKI